jgi:hypothetical protein
MALIKLIKFGLIKFNFVFSKNNQKFFGTCLFKQFVDNYKIQYLIFLSILLFIKQICF